MFNLYQSINRQGDPKDQKESETTGHDRFYQERTNRRSFRKKKKPICRRVQSAAELNPVSIAAANKRLNFRTRSASNENDSEDEPNNSLSEKTPLVAQKIDSLAKLLFNKSLINSPSGSLRGSPVEENRGIVKTADFGTETNECNMCTEFLENNPRYEYISELESIGSRAEKSWFGIKDCSIKTERLLTIIPMKENCPLEPTERSRAVVVELFRTLQHPYIYPVLDVSFFKGCIITIIPFNSRGSLRDLISGTNWRDDWETKNKSNEGGTAGLPLWQVGRLGRHILEGLQFLEDRGFPPFKHLHSGNVIVQNGIARICGLDNTLLGLPPKNHSHGLNVSSYPEVLGFGHLLFEMCAGYELDCPAPTPAHLQIELENYPQVAEILDMIFSKRTPTLGELVTFEIFRKVDLREMKGSCLPNFNQRLSQSCVSLLNQVARCDRVGKLNRTFLPRSAGCSPTATPPPRRKNYTTDDFNSSWYY